MRYSFSPLIFLAIFMLNESSTTCAYYNFSVPFSIDKITQSSNQDPSTVALIATLCSAAGIVTILYVIVSTIHHCMDRYPTPPQTGTTTTHQRLDISDPTFFENLIKLGENTDHITTFFDELEKRIEGDCDRFFQKLATELVAHTKQNQATISSYILAKALETNRECAPYLIKKLAPYGALNKKTDLYIAPFSAIVKMVLNKYATLRNVMSYAATCDYATAQLVNFDVLDNNKISQWLAKRIIEPPKKRRHSASFIRKRIQFFEKFIATFSGTLRKSDFQNFRAVTMNYATIKNLPTITTMLHAISKATLWQVSPMKKRSLEDCVFLFDHNKKESDGLEIIVLKD